MNNSLYYKLPTSAESYRPKNDKVEDFGTYDFIVVGSGAAGSVVANRLSEVKKWKVLLLEAGGPESDFSVIPAMNGYLLNSKFNWNHYTTKQSNACQGTIDQSCAIATGKALGGTTAINAMVYCRGNKNDYNRWAAQGNNGWSYEDVLPYFIKSENSEINGDPGYHGRGGYWNVEFHRLIKDNMPSFIEGSNIVSYSPSTDYNGREELGAFYSQANTNKQYRQSTSKAFLEPIMNRPNLKILTYSYVTKVVIDNLSKIATGVTFTRNGSTYLALARKEVIISAGSINSPQILMLSGIGPQQHLQQMKIPVIQNLPIGHNLQDHLIFYGLFIRTNLTAQPLTLREQIKQFLDGYGPLTMAIDTQGFIFPKSENETTPDLPDYMIEVKPDMGSNSYLPLILKLALKPEVLNTLNTLFKRNDFDTSVGAFLYVFNTRSVGKVTLRSNDPFEYPEIDISYLDNQHDIDIMYDGIKLLEKLVKTEPLRKINASLVYFDYPECRDKKMGTKDYWVCAFRLLGISGNNPTATCRMGPDANTSVVNNRGKVYGISGLRVADASITPFSLACHNAAPTVMIGEKISDYIKLDHGLKIEPITNVIL